MRCELLSLLAAISSSPPLYAAIIIQMCTQPQKSGPESGADVRYAPFSEVSVVVNERKESPWTDRFTYRQMTRSDPFIPQIQKASYTRSFRQWPSPRAVEQAINDIPLLLLPRTKKELIFVNLFDMAER